MELYDNNLIKLSEFKSIYNHIMHSIIEHSNGKNYLVFSIDLYGYSIIDLTNYNVYHFVPEESFKKNEETFIWTEVFYCKKNNIIAVDGCYWAHPYSTQFFNFSNPEDLPYELLYSSSDIEGEINVDEDVISLRWTEDGLIVLNCCVNSEGEEEGEKVVDILALAKVNPKE